MARNHCCVWLNHQESKVFELAPNGVDTFQVQDREPHRVRRGSDRTGQGGISTSIAYFSEIAAALKPYKAVLIVGTDTARNEFAGYLVEHETLLRSRIWGVEAMDHPTPDDIALSAHKFFRVPDRMPG
jgi:hypothetical protein